MLTSVKIQRRQSEIRQALAPLVANDNPSEDETRQIETLDLEFRQNETRYRAALIAEDEERREAGAELETRGEREYADLVAGFEMRQVARYLDEGRQLEGRTAEVVQELRSANGYRGVPVPWQALELRAGETVSTGTPDPMQTRPIIDRLFPDSVAGRMGASMINIGSGSVEWPVATAGASVGWQSSETGNVASPSAYATTDHALSPDHTLGVQMRITRKALKQSGEALEQAVRRDMNAAIAVEMDRVVFLGSGADGEPLGVITGAATYGITNTDIGAAPDWAAFRSAVLRFMLANSATGPAGVRLMLRPEVWDATDDLITGLAISEWDRIAAKIGNTVLTTNALAAPSGDPAESVGLLTTSAGGVAPIFVGTWGAVDMIRDPFSDAQSGGLRITALATMDVTVARASQLEIISGIQ
ncbi:phage major capsid protein [Acuticoccus mangrovi]|uniref:Phage major capsid protein n=1 Tax=Acuticoccus mangrovi TaxID=2796142 RepID=A0A934IMY3_9HYPH|nr:phage major capsid protein [Acuticoccus mangrovi]MBJ3777871.1 phage major capsid protein [Acuticoccus mangrovi]